MNTAQATTTTAPNTNDLVAFDMLTSTPNGSPKGLRYICNDNCGDTCSAGL
jgi:hypothetical protein